MKKTTLLLIALLATVALCAQVPSAFNFQAVLRDAKGDFFQNKEVYLDILLLEDNVTPIYKTSITTHCDSMGMIHISIPQKEIVSLSDPLSKVLSSVTGTLWIQIKASIFDKLEVIEFPAQQVVSVPYSMMSGNVMLISPNGNKYSLKVDDNGILSASLVNGVDSTSNIIPSRKYIVMDDFGLDSKVTVRKFKGVIRTQQEYETLLGKVPDSKVDFTKYSLVLFVESVVLKDFYLEKISDTKYKFKRVYYPNPIGVIDVIAYGLLIPKIDESVTIDFSSDSPY
ncbi:MAG: hypothetical protein PHX49_10255 [Bacteroidales bacterium]|nr:hypothetical protein [Bacteroidales bacterium]